jgi:signal transduction histidine kinase
MPVRLTGPLVDPRYEVPLSGRYWQVRPITGGEALRSRSLWDQQLAVPQDGNGQDLLSVRGPSGQQLAALARIVHFDTAAGDRAFQVAVAQDRAAIDRSIQQFRQDMSLALVVVGIALVGAAALLIHIGLMPLNQVKIALQQVRHGTARQLPKDFPHEVMPLVNEVNSLLDARDETIEAARRRAADLAHGLKTPLSALTATSEKLRQSGNTHNAATLQRIAEEMAERIDYQLRLAGLRPRRGDRAFSASVNQALLRTIAVLRKTPRGESLYWADDLPADLAVKIDNHDLMELVGFVLEYAAQWAHSAIEVTMAREADQVHVEIRDDGPGLTQEQIDSLGARGKRLDETRSGTGLGLAIAHEILAINAGALTIEALQPRGLSVCISLPVASGQAAEAEPA